MSDADNSIALPESVRRPALLVLIAALVIVLAAFVGSYLASSDSLVDFFDNVHWTVSSLADSGLGDPLLKVSFSVVTLVTGWGAMSWRGVKSTNPKWERYCEDALRLLPLLVVMTASVAVVLAWVVRDAPRAAQVSSVIGDGGWLTVDSGVGKGTTPQVFLSASEASKSPEPVMETTAPHGGSETILLVEDDPAVRLLTRSILERHGYRVLEAAHGVEALTVWEQHSNAIQLLLTDMVMPENMSGSELAARLRGYNPDLRVVFTSGYSPDIAGRELDLQTGQDFIQKPSSSQQLLATVRRCLDH